MIPPQKEFERVSVDDFITGFISGIEYDMAREVTYKGVKKPPAPYVRLKFTLDGYKEPKYSGWLSFMYAEKANLYKKYLTSLVENAIPNMKFDIEQLKGLKVKILFKNSDDGKYQNVDTIRPVGPKIQADPNFVAETEEETVPF